MLNGTSGGPHKCHHGSIAWVCQAAWNVSLDTVTVQVSGSTATVAAVTGWEVLIANVGDSCAYLDTGVEVILVRAYSAPV